MCGRLSNDRPLKYELQNNDVFSFKKGLLDSAENCSNRIVLFSCHTTIFALKELVLCQQFVLLPICFYCLLLGICLGNVLRAAFSSMLFNVLVISSHP